jgi:hypothetical protein
MHLSSLTSSIEAMPGHPSQPLPFPNASNTPDHHPVLPVATTSTCTDPWRARATPDTAPTAMVVLEALEGLASHMKKPQTPMNLWQQLRDALSAAAMHLSPHELARTASLCMRLQPHAPSERLLPDAVVHAALAHLHQMDSEHICDTLRALHQADEGWSKELDMALVQAFSPHATLGARPTARKVGRVLKVVCECGWSLATTAAGRAVVDAASRSTGTPESSARLQQLLRNAGAMQKNVEFADGSRLVMQDADAALGVSEQSERQQQLLRGPTFQ